MRELWTTGNLPALMISSKETAFWPAAMMAEETLVSDNPFGD
jgi:hypothetical protein